MMRLCACLVLRSAAHMTMEPEDWAVEAQVPPPEPHEILGHKVQVKTFQEMDGSRSSVRNHPVFQHDTAHFHGPSTMEEVTEFLRSHNGNPSTETVDVLRSCRDDPSCKWIWTTSELLMGSEIEITGVLGYFNTTDVGANRCHVKSREQEAWCHYPDPSFKATRGRAFLLEGVPTGNPDQSALPIAAMCHSMKMQNISKIEGKVDADAPKRMWSKVDHIPDLWCHLVSGREFLVVPQQGIVEVGLVNSSTEPSDLMKSIGVTKNVRTLLSTRPRRELMLSKSDAFELVNLGSGNQVGVGYTREANGGW